MQGQPWGLFSSGHTGPQHWDASYPEVTAFMCATAPVSCMQRGYCPAHMHPGLTGREGQALACGVGAAGPPDSWAPGWGLHGGNRSRHSYSHWEVFAVPCEGKATGGPWCPLPEITASPAQDRGQSPPPSPSSACPEPGALPGKPQTVQKGGQLGGRECGPGGKPRVGWAGL